MRLPTLALATLLLLPLALAGPAGPTILAPQQGPTVPAASAPVATLLPFNNDTWSYAEGVRTHAVTIPGGWSRVVLTFTDNAGTDPWDRLFGVGINGAEVLHGTTARAPMTVAKDVTSYAALFPAGSTANVTLHFGTWVGWQKLTVRLDFYDDATSAAVEGPHAATLAPFEFAGMCCDGSALDAQVAFPAATPSRAIVELTTSGHGEDGEFPYLAPLDATPHPPTYPTFHVLVDGQEIATVLPYPYTYALVGLGGSSTVDVALEGAIWWTGQQAANDAGLHATGTGVIPPYRGALPSDVLPLLTGARDVKVTESWNPNEGGYWPVSVTFHVDP